MRLFRPNQAAEIDFPITMIRSTLLKFPALYETLNRFRDSKIHKKLMKKGSFSQHGEDIKILQLVNELNPQGIFVDIGCNHPFRLSNTYLLYLSGMRGICVDPLPRFRPMFEKYRPDDQFVCNGVGETAGTMTLYEFEADVLSTFDEQLAQRYVKNGYRLRRELNTEIKRIDTILDDCRVVTQPISFLSIDVEGHELTALKSLSLDKWLPSYICLEVITADGGKNTAAIEYLNENDYEAYEDLGLNIIFSRCKK